MMNKLWRANYYEKCFQEEVVLQVKYIHEHVLGVSRNVIKTTKRHVRKLDHARKDKQLKRLELLSIQHTYSFN